MNWRSLYPLVVLNIFRNVVSNLQFRHGKLYILLRRVTIDPPHRRNFQTITMVLLFVTSAQNSTLPNITLPNILKLQYFCILNDVRLLPLGLHLQITGILNLLHGLINDRIFLNLWRSGYLLLYRFGVYQGFALLLYELQQFLSALANYKNIPQFGAHCVEFLLDFSDCLLLLHVALPLIFEIDLLSLQKLLVLLVRAILPQVQAPLILQILIGLNSKMLNLFWSGKLRHCLSRIASTLCLKLIDDLQIQLGVGLLFSKYITILELQPLSMERLRGQTAKQKPEIEVSMQDWFLFIKQQDLIKLIQYLSNKPNSPLITAILTPPLAIFSPLFWSAIVLLAYLGMTESKNEPVDIWLDCDPGLDDILAIIYAALSDKFNLIGLTTSPGNSTLENTTRNALDILYHIGRSDVQVYEGSNQLINGEMRFAEHVHGENGLGDVNLKVSPAKSISQDGLLGCYKRIMAHPNPIIWVNTGSLTNLCILFLSYPLIKQKIKQIVIMGGAITKGNRTPAAEFNIYFDPMACKNVLNLKGAIPMVIIPLQTTHMNVADGPVYQRMKKHSNHPFGLALYQMMLKYQAFCLTVDKMPYPPYHDPLCLFYILHPEEFEAKAADVEVDVYPLSYGRTNVFFSYPGKPTIQSSTLVTTNLLNQKVKFWDEMMALIDLIFTEERQKHIGIDY